MIMRSAMAALLVLVVGSVDGASLDRRTIEQNKKLDEQLLKAHALKDTDLLMSCFSKREDAFFIAPNGTLNSGPAAIRASFQRFFDGLETIRGEIKEISYLPAQGGVIAVGTVIYHRKPKGQPPDERTVIWTDYRVKENGRWVYLFRHAHWPLAPPK
jgi:ketosteroid isomerase-like protein